MEIDFNWTNSKFIRKVEIKTKIQTHKKKQHKTQKKQNHKKGINVITAITDEDSQGEDVNKWAEHNIAFLNNSNTWGNAALGADWIQAQETIHKADIVDTTKGNQQLDDKKLTYLEYQDKSPQLKGNQNQLHFQDLQFPPNLTSLTGQWGYLPKYKDVNWEKVTQKISNCRIFKQKISHKDTTQGKLGDCYFLATIAALAERPDRIFNLFLIRQINQRKYFSVKMLFKGRWRVIDLDEYFPFHEQKPVFSRAKKDQLWVMIMQKAWAKLYTSYMRISSGNAEQPLHDLTGAPITFYKLKDKSLNKEQLWKYLLKASKRQYAMCTSSNAGSDQKMSETGIVQGHAYTLLNAINLVYKQEKIKLLQLRNPWGRKEGSGNWSDKDKKWKDVSEEQKKRICFNPKQNDGIFYIEFEDYLRQYRALVVAEVNDNASYIYQTIKDPNIEGVYFKVQVLNEGIISFQVDKPPKRSFNVKQQQKYRYPKAHVKIFSEQANYDQVHNFYDDERLTSRKYTMSKGIYLVYVIIYFDTFIQKDYDVTLALYSECSCNISLASNGEKKKVAGCVGENQNIKRKAKSLAKIKKEDQSQNVILKGAVRFNYVNPWNAQSTLNQNQMRPKIVNPVAVNQNTAQNLDEAELVQMQVKKKRHIVHLGGKGQHNKKMGQIDQNLIKQLIKTQNCQIINSIETDVLQFTEKQIIFIQPSPALKKLQELRNKKMEFFDDRFVPNQSSLCGQWESLPQWKNVRWERISKVMPNAQIFQGHVSPCSIKQGFLGDCYFLAGIAALAQRPLRILNLFLLNSKNQLNFYSVKMLYRGKWLTIDMDDYIPFMYEFPAFSSANKDQLWVILLQKAWAKMYGSFKKIQAGFPEQTLHDLTGAPIRHIYMQRSPFNPQTEWQYLMKATSLQYSMVASSQAGFDTAKSTTGIVQGHAYTLLQVVQLKFKQGRRVVKLRNPWGKGQGIDQWSDNDPNWNLVDPLQRERVGFTNANDGIFFMPYQHFCKQFKVITVAQINDNASYIYKSFKDPHKNGVFFKIQILKKGFYSLQVDTTPERIFQFKYNSNYQYPTVRMQLGKMNEQGYINRLSAMQSNSRTLYNGSILEVGSYICFTRINFDQKYQKDFQVNLAIYAEVVCKLTLASHKQAILFTNNPQINWSGQETSKGQWNVLRSYKPDKPTRKK